MSVVIVQSLFLLAHSANFLLAETGTEPITVEFIDLPTSSPFSGSQTISAQTSETVNSVTFKVVPDINGVEYTPYSGTIVSGFDNKYSFVWPTDYFTDRTYNLEAIAYDGTNLIYVSHNFQVQNETNPSSGSGTTEQTVEITVSESGNRSDFQAVSNMPLENVMFHFDNLSDSTSSIQFPGTITDTANITGSISWMINLADSDLVSNIDYNFYATGYFEGTLYSSINDILIPAQDIETTTDNLRG